MMNTKNSMELMNDYLLGRYTEWDSFALYIIALIIVGIVVFMLVLLFVDRKAPEESLEWIKKQMTIAAISGTLILVGYGAYLIFK